MSKHPETDYFSSTTMTFGEHLDELRHALVKAVIALVIGFVIGLMVANHVVAYVQTPLEHALENHRLQIDLDHIEHQYGEKARAQMESFMKKNRFVRENNLSFGYMYVEADEIARMSRALGIEVDVNAAKNNKESVEFTIPTSGTILYRLRTWIPVKVQAKALSAQEAFMIWMKAGFVTGAVIASPLIFFYIWNFVAAGLYPHEQKYVYVYLPFSLGLFLAGSGTAFFFVFEPVLNFLFQFNRSMNIDPDPRISEWISFVLILPLGFGVAFQLPLVMLFINRLGIISLQMFTEKWRIAILAIFVISMVLTPADPVSMLFMAVPLSLLYFLGIALCLYMPRHRSPFAEE